MADTCLRPLKTVTDMQYLGIDIETYCDISLPDVGVYKYVAHPSFEVLLFAYSVDNGPVQLVDFANGEVLPEEVHRALYSPAVVKTAYNATFERLCLSAYLGEEIPVEQWECTMVKAAMCGLPLGLAAVGKALSLDSLKMEAGKQLIPFFSCPCKPTKSNNQRTRNLPKHDPDRWELFKSYCIRDVEVEQNIRQRLQEYPIARIDSELYIIDQNINDRGVLLDRKMVENAIAIADNRSSQLEQEAVKVTGLSNVNSPLQVREWLRKRTGYTDIDSIDKARVQELLGAVIAPDVRRFLEIRQELGKTSLAKYPKMLEVMGEDDRVRGTMQFYGTRTGRWAGRFIQVQNLPQNHLENIAEVRQLVVAGDAEMLELLYGDVQDTLSQLIRTVLVAPKGSRFIVADFSAIEARVLAWLAGEQWRLDTFRGSGKIYEASAAQMFKVPVESVTKGSEMRAKGKVAELACGYGGGVGALRAMGGEKMGLTDEQMKDIVRHWRKASPNIVKFWTQAENAMFDCIANRQLTIVNKYVLAECDDQMLWFILPSGRRLCYYSPYIYADKDLMYWSVDSKTRKWGPTTTYGGKITENIVQAIARDCLAETLIKLSKAGYRCVFHIHDEVVLEMPYGEGSLEEVLEIMAQSPSWAPTLPLKGDGYETEFYMKD